MKDSETEKQQANTSYFVSDDDTSSTHSSMPDLVECYNTTAMEENEEYMAFANDDKYDSDGDIMFHNPDPELRYFENLKQK